MKSLSIRMKLVTLIVGPGIILGVLLAVYAANLARNMGEEIVRDDARLITHFLIEDLAVALDAFPTDQGLALKKALDLGRYDNEEYSSRLNGVAVFNKSMEYLDSYNIGPESPTEGKSVGNLTMEDRDEKQPE